MARRAERVGQAALVAALCALSFLTGFQTRGVLEHAPAPAFAEPGGEDDGSGSTHKAGLTGVDWFPFIQCPTLGEEDFQRLQIPLAYLPRKKKTSVSQKYDRRAHNCAREGIWHRVTLKDHEKILNVIAQQLELTGPGMAVFDWGSGCGHKLRWLGQKHGTHGFGIDISPKTIEYSQNTIHNARFCLADGSRMEWIPTNTFDRSFSFGSVLHVYNQTLFCHVLREMVRITKPGGRMINGWTEDIEYPRASLVPCLTEGDWMPNARGNHVTVVEETTVFDGIATFPLKTKKRHINTYTVVVDKALHRSYAADDEMKAAGQGSFDGGEGSLAGDQRAKKGAES